MLVANTIELRRRSPSIICLETTMGIRLIGAFLIAFPFYLIILTSSDSYPSKGLMIICLSLMVTFGFYLFGRFKRLCFDAQRQRIYHWVTFLLLPVKSEEFGFEQITDLKIEDRSYGQTFQQKYRLFLKTSGSEIDIGLVNQLDKAESIRKKILNFTDQDKSAN